MTPEGKVKASIRKTLDAMGVWYYMPVNTGYGRNGIPDFICCFKGRFIAVEAKAGDEQPTALQQRELSAIAEHDGLNLVVNERNLLQLEKLITKVYLEDSFRQ